MRRGFTLIEMIITVAITGVLSVGMFKAFEAITVRSEKAKILTTLSLDSQSALDQLSLLLYNRAPMSLKSCTNATDCVVMDETTSGGTILQWYGTASESYQAGDYSGFVDMNRSVKPNLYTPNTFHQKISDTQDAKWGSHALGLVFAGTFEDGESIDPYSVTIDEDNKIVFNSSVPTKIFEKYYLVDTAYAVTRKGDVASLSCTHVSSALDDNALLLFYDYRPWKGEDFCTNGKVSILSLNVEGFKAHLVNGTIRLGIDMNKTVGNDTTRMVRLSKQKVVF